MNCYLEEGEGNSKFKSTLIKYHLLHDIMRNNKANLFHLASGLINGAWVATNHGTKTRVWRRISSVNFYLYVEFF